MVTREQQNQNGHDIIKKTKQGNKAESTRFSLFSVKFDEVVLREKFVKFEGQSQSMLDCLSYQNEAVCTG